VADVGLDYRQEVNLVASVELELEQDHTQDLEQASVNALRRSVDTRGVDRNKTVTRVHTTSQLSHERRLKCDPLSETHSVGKP
jgi:hypothetical protein